MGNETFKATGKTEENLAAAQEGARKAHSEREIEGHTLKQGMGARKTKQDNFSKNYCSDRAITQ